MGEKKLFISDLKEGRRKGGVSLFDKITMTCDEHGLLFTVSSFR